MSLFFAPALPFSAQAGAHQRVPLRNLIPITLFACFRGWDNNPDQRLDRLALLLGVGSVATIWLFGQQIWGLRVFLQICQNLKPAELCEFSSTHELITGRALLARLS